MAKKNSLLKNLDKQTLNSQGMGGGFVSIGYTGRGLLRLTPATKGLHFFSKDKKIFVQAIKRDAIHKMYGILRSYPRYIKYLERQKRREHLETYSHFVKKDGQYQTLIKEQKKVANKKYYTDRIIGNVVMDYLELKINNEGFYFDKEAGEMKANSTYQSEIFVDLQPKIQVSSKNNVLLTQVQGRDFTRKEYISGGDYEISISGLITSKYPDVYPEAEVAKFLRLMAFKGVLDCDNTILRQFKIEQLIILNYSFPTADCRNIQPYTLNCVAVEPSEPVALLIGVEQDQIMPVTNFSTDKWMKILRVGTKLVEPTALLKQTQRWI